MSDCFRIKRSPGRVTEIRRIPTGNADVTRRTAPNTNPDWLEEEKTKRETSRWLRRGRNSARITDYCVTMALGTTPPRLPYRCNGSKQIILANENAGLPAQVNVYNYEDSRAKRDCSHLSRLEARSIPWNYVGLTAALTILAITSISYCSINIQYFFRRYQSHRWRQQTTYGFPFPMAEVEAKLSALKKFKSYLIRKLLEQNRWGLVANEEADAADSRSQSDKCIPIESGLPVPSDTIPRPLTYMLANNKFTSITWFHLRCPRLAERIHGYLLTVDMLVPEQGTTAARTSSGRAGSELSSGCTGGPLLSRAQICEIYCP
ncbi:hypothetical protein ALC56_03884 [Trachymyrmex septentrionalis]|uniref:Uncharacterized protein n=1 Tax=Trachymyrmex septentrionalis TaxID=34720 RepID=A0A195FMW3_9HYME|nr:hypothetical protein ALC56_03884 [Trachymyrmex septentrionalis]